MRHQLATYFEKKKILPTGQYGFRQGLSTVHAAGAVEHDWKKAKSNGSHCGALLFDLSAAFDTLDVDLLEKKMAAYGVGMSGLKWLRAYLTGRKQVVDYGGYQSHMLEVKVGSPQGSVVSPFPHHGGGSPRLGDKCNNS